VGHQVYTNDIKLVS